MKKNENIYTSRYIQGLEDVYCHSRSAVTSEMGLSCGSASLPTRIINGGKKVIYTTTMAAMLLNNMAPYAYADLTVEAGQTSTGLKVGTNASNTVISRLYNYGTTNSTTINSGGGEYISSGIANYTNINRSGWQAVSYGGIANDTMINSGGHQGVYLSGVANRTNINSNAGQTIYNRGVANDT